MTTATDRELLEQYVQHASQQAFTRLVQRHADWVYSLALRRVSDPATAEDVAQAVFLLLATKAAKVPSSRGNIHGWLFNVARYASASALRTEMRRRRHERKAAEMKPESYLDSVGIEDSQGLWSQLAPRLDELVACLRRVDRDALLLRFFQRKSLAEVGAALGISEEAARKRVAKAVERLRGRLVGGGIPLHGEAMSGLMLASVTHAAPAPVLQGCVAASAGASGNSANAGTIANGAAKMMVGLRIRAAAIMAAGTVAGAAVVISAVQFLSSTLAATPPPAPGAASASTAPATLPVVIKDGMLGKARLSCAGQLTQIGVLLMLHTSQNRGLFPTDMGTLALSGGRLDPWLFLCPTLANKKAPTDWASMSPQQRRDWINQNCDYVYVGGGLNPRAGNASQLVLAYDRPENDSDSTINVLFMDGSVHSMTPDRAKRAIETSARLRGQAPPAQ
jgi:RNA polymerase sigma factor (sigma-70 family)